jgi:hypothetical protein
MLRFWFVCKHHGYVSVSDFAKGRLESRSLALAVLLSLIFEASGARRGQDQTVRDN